MRTKPLGVALFAALLSLLATAVPAVAAGDVGCRATALRVQLAGPLPPVESATANAADATCADDDQVVTTASAGTVAAAVLSASTDRDPDGGDPLSATASSRTTDVIGTIAGLVVPVTAKVLTSAVSVRCVSGAPAFASSGQVADVRLKTGLLSPTITVNGSEPSTINLPLVGKLYLNRVTTSATTITRQALLLDTALVDVVIGESTVSTTGTPCALPPPRAACADGIDNGDAEDTLPDNLDPGCLSGPGGTYDPTDDDEADPPPPPAACADGIDNDAPADGRVDADDPGCLSGPGGTYDPADGDETDPLPQPQCSDGVDDGDLEDLLADEQDPGCLSGPGGAYDPADDDETDPPPPACSDGVDDDDAEDGLSDAADPGCKSGPDGAYDPLDDDESDAGSPQCSDGLDNDGDNRIDFGPVPNQNDSGCRSATWDDERGQCQDGIDNADPEDTLVDMADPGCQSPSDNFERDPQCLNGIDDDGDGKVDHPDDPGCTSRHDDSEGTR